MRKPNAGGGWPAIWYALRKARAAGGLLRMYRALRSKNTCKTCALGMGGQQGGMVNEAGRFPEVCKKSIQAMAADMAGGIRPGFFEDFGLDKMRAMTSRELEAAGRITEPMIAGPLDGNFKAITWDDALDRIAAKLAATEPAESFFYFSGRSSNEAGFLGQLFARLWGTNNVNNCSFYCHQASGVGLSTVTGSPTATVVLDDIAHCDLLVIIGANPASNHPRFMRTLLEHRRRGGKVIVINPLRELGLVRFKVPSDLRSLLMGSQIADLYAQPHIGGDIAFMAGVAKSIIERDAVDETFVREHAVGWEAFAARIANQPWDRIERDSGVDRATIEQVAEIYAASERTIFCWAMGITHHVHGVENVQMIANLAMARGMLGKPHAGLLPLRGHSNVQGMGSMGVVPNLKPAVRKRIEETFGVTLPEGDGMDTLASLAAAEKGKIRFAWCLGGNLLGSNPDLAAARRALAHVDQVVYLSTTLNTGHVHGRGRETIILPVLARDEEPQTTTQESMFNYVRRSDGGPKRFDGPRSEVEIVCALAERVLGNVPVDWSALRDHERVREAIGKVIPGYDPIGSTGQEFQIDGRTFHKPRFATDDGRARFHDVDLPELAPTGNGTLRLMTVRSEGQFNTVVYEDQDIYRGQDRRDVVMLNPADIDRLGLAVDDRITVRSDAGALEGLVLRAIDVRAGNAVMYFPEANAIVPQVADPKSRTPAFKNTTITIEKTQDPLSEREGVEELAGTAQRQEMRSC